MPGLDFRLSLHGQHVRGIEFLKKVSKTPPGFCSEAAHPSMGFRNSHTELPSMDQVGFLSQNPHEGHHKQSGASKSVENLITI